MNNWNQEIWNPTVERPHVFLVGWKVTFWMGPNKFLVLHFDLMNLTFWKMPKYSLHWKVTSGMLPNNFHYWNATFWNLPKYLLASRIKTSFKNPFGYPPQCGIFHDPSNGLISRIFMCTESNWKVCWRTSQGDPFPKFEAIWTRNNRDLPTNFPLFSTDSETIFGSFLKPINDSAAFKR